jgi:hypothetical protein
MPTSLPTKMSMFENAVSLSTSSYIIGLDMYGGQLSNVKVSASIAGYELSRKRWILNPPVTSSNDVRGDDGAESYNSGQYWVKSGSVWLELVVTGSNSGGTISSSYQLSDGGGEEFGAGNNVTFGRANIGAITGSKINIVAQANIGTSILDEHFVTGSLNVSGSLRTTGTATIRAKTYIKFDSAADGIYFISGSGFTQAASIILANSRVNFSSTTGTTPSGFTFNTGTVSNAVLVRDNGSLNVFGSGSFGKTTSNAVLDVNGDTIVTGSLTVTTGSIVITGSSVYPLDITSTTGNANFRVIDTNNSTAFGYFTNGFGTGRVGVGNLSMFVGGQAGMGTVIQAGNIISMVINTSGSVVIGNAASSARLNISGSAVVTGSIYINNGTLIGTASYALNAKSNNVYNVKDYGAVGDGTTNDTTAIQTAINAVKVAGFGTVYFPDGTFVITGSLTIPSNPQCDISLEGEGSNITIIKQTSNTNAIYFDMNDGSGWANDYQVAIKSLAFKTSGQASTAIHVTYGTLQYSQHSNISVDINDVHIYSDGSNYWNNGIVLESAWNFRISNTMVIGKTGSSPYNGTGLEIRRMCVNGSINQSQFNFWKTGIFVNTVDYTSAGMNTEGLFLDQIYMVPVNYGVYVKGNKTFYNAPFNSNDWAGRPIAGRMVLFSFNDSHIDSRDSGNALLLENVQSHYISNNLMISDGTGSVVYGSNAYEGTFTGNTLFNAGSAPSIYIGGYSGSANIVTGNVFRGGSTHVLLESSSIYNKVYGNIAYDALNISVTNAGSNNLVGSVGN